MNPVLLIPGLLCSPEIFAPQLPPLWSRVSVMVASTLIGETVAGMATTILEAAPPRFALAGISMGGYLCFEILRRAPERVDRLALIDTTARPDTSEQTAQRRATLAQAKGAFLETSRQTLDGLMHPARRDDEALRGINRRMAETVGAEGFARQMELIIARPDSRPMLSQINVPTAVIVGEADVLTPVDRSAEIAAAIPGATLTVVPECGHLSTIERPEAVNDALLRWLSGRVLL